MTLGIAVELSIKVWRTLSEWGCEKQELPPVMYHAIKDMEARCPLCHYFFSIRDDDCERCPLENCDNWSLWMYWHDAETKYDKSKYARGIVQKLKEYFIHEQMYQDYTETELREQ